MEDRLQGPCRRVSYPIKGDPLYWPRLTTDHIGRFVAHKKSGKKPKSNASINRWLEALGRAYTIGRAWEPPKVRKTLKIEMLDESDNVQEGFLNREQYEALLIELPSHLQTLLVLGFV